MNVGLVNIFKSNIFFKGSIAQCQVLPSAGNTCVSQCQRFVIADITFSFVIIASQIWPKVRALVTFQQSPRTDELMLFEQVLMSQLLHVIIIAR